MPPKPLKDLGLLLDKLTGEKAVPVAGRVITSNSPATGGLRPNVTHGQTHTAGSEVDLKWVPTTGKAQSKDFYRLLPGVSAISSGRHNTKPIANLPQIDREYTREEREKDAQTLREKNKDKARDKWEMKDWRKEAERQAGTSTGTPSGAKSRQWIVADDYDRTRTRALIEQIVALVKDKPNRIRHIYFNDPHFLAGANNPVKTHGIPFKPIGGHADHVHLSVNFDRADSRPPGTTGAGPWPPA